MNKNLRFISGIAYGVCIALVLTNILSNIGRTNFFFNIIINSMRLACLIFMVYSFTFTDKIKHIKHIMHVNILYIVLTIIIMLEPIINS